MSSSSIAREIKSLWELINAGSYKQALVKVNKELKKSPNHPYWLALNSFIYSKQNKRDDAVALADKVAKTGPTNLTILSLLQEIYTKYGLDHELNSIFEAAVRKSGTGKVDSELLEMWIDSMIDRGYVKGFVQCSMANQKLLQTRESVLQACLAMCFSCNGIESSDDGLQLPSATDSEKKIFPMLALKMLEKIQPMTNSQEGYVYALVLNMSKTDSALANQINYLQSDLVRQWESLDLILLLLKSLEGGKMWDKLFIETKGLLTFREGEHSLDNWLYWEALNKSAIELEKVEEAQEFIRSFTPSSRNSLLALIDLYAKSNNDRLIDDAVKPYFRSFSNKRCAYEDIKKYFDYENFDRVKFLKWLDEYEGENGGNDQSLSSLDTKLNIYKFRSLLAIDGSAPTIDQLISSYNKSKSLLDGKDPKDYFSADDFILIANSKLLLSTKEDPYAIEKAILLLESTALSDKHQFYVRLWLVRLYLIIGCFTQAQTHYNTLSVKMIQNENTSHSLLTRCSTLHPAKDAILQTNDIYNQIAEITPYTKYALSKHAYTQVEGFIDLNRKLKTSLNHRLIALEQIKVQRLLDPSGNANLTKLEEDFNNPPQSYSDNRDFSTIANTDFQPHNNTLPISQTLTIGPKQTTIWAKAFILRENIIRLLLNPDQALLKQSCDELKSVYPNNPDFTEEEKWSFEIIDLLVSCTLDKNSPNPYTNISNKLSELTIPTTSTSSSWSYLHRSFTILETCKVITGFLTRLKVSRHQYKINFPSLEELTTSIKAISKQVQQSALDIKNTRNKRYQTAVEALAPWAEERNIPSSFVENILDGIGIAQDKSLTVLRTITV